MLSSPTPAGEVTRPALCWITVTGWPASWCLAFDLLLTVLLLCIHLIGSCSRARANDNKDAYAFACVLWSVLFASVCFALICLVSLLDGSNHPSITSAYVLLLERWCGGDTVQQLNSLQLVQQQHETCPHACYCQLLCSCLVCLWTLVWCVLHCCVAYVLTFQLCVV